MIAQLHENLALLRSIVQGAPFPVAVYIGKDLTIELANDHMIQAYGKGRDVIGKSYRQILPELENQEIFDQCLTVMETGIPFHAKNQHVEVLIGGNLKSFYYDYSFIPLYDSEGRIYGVMNTGNDLTNLTLARQQLVESDEKLRLAIASANMGTYEMDLVSGDIVTSGNFGEIWGVNDKFTREDILNKIHPDDLAIRNEAYQEGLQTGLIQYEVRAFRAKDDLRRLRINGKVLYNHKKEAIGLLGIVQDITEETQFAEQLKRQVKKRTRELKRSNEDLMQFANVVSHDLKEPVRKIRFFNSLLMSEMGDHLQGKSKIYLDKVELSSQRMGTIIDGILNYATVNKASQSVETINLGLLLDDIKTDLELVIHEKQAILIREDLPEMQGGRVLIQQLFYNLIHNALKFSRPDNPPRVIISGKTVVRDGIEFLKVSVKDNGIGIDPGFSQKIFNAFERLHSKDEFEGTGLGLSLCKKIVDRHRGHIEVQGILGEGAEFLVWLPVNQNKTTI